jgi:hypothetical protein
MLAQKGTVISPLQVPKSVADAVLRVTRVSISVEPSVGRGAKLILRTELITRSNIFLRAAACPCTVTRTLPVPYSAFSQWFIFVISELDRAASAQPAQSLKSGQNPNSGPQPEALKTDSCTLAELLNVFGVRCYAVMPVLRPTHHAGPDREQHASFCRARCRCLNRRP